MLSLQQTSRTALQLLHALAGLLPATEVDEHGLETVVQPLLKTLLTLASPTCLPRLCQVGGGLFVVTEIVYVQVFVCQTS